MFEHDRYIFIGPATAVVQAAITQAPQTEGRKVNFTVSAKNVTEKDVSDFTLLAAQNGESLTLTVRTESLRVDETDANGQSTVVLEDGEPVAELGVSMEDVTPLEPSPVSTEYLALIKATAERFGVPIEEAGSEHSLSIEGMEGGLLSGTTPGSVERLRSGAHYISVAKENATYGYYVQDDLSRVGEDSEFFDRIRDHRSDYPPRISFVISNDSDTETLIPEALDDVSHLAGIHTYLVKPGTVRTSIGAANESLRTSWNIKVPSIRRALPRQRK